MKYFLILFVSLLAWSTNSKAQSPKVAFNQAANHFIEGQNQEALQSVNAGLQRHPNDARLKALKEKLEEQQKQQQQQKQKEQQQEDADKKEEQQQSQQQEQEGKEGEEKKEEGKKKEQEGEKKQEGQENKEGEEQKEGQKPQEQPKPGESETEQRLKEMDISPEKARMILEAMKSNEVQYLQQKKRKASQRSNNGKPDW